MTVAVAGAAFFWLSRIQNQLQGGVESFQGNIQAQMSSAVDVLDADYTNDTSKDLIIFFQNNGAREIIIENKTDFPTTTWILRDSNQVAICSSSWNFTSPASCTYGCGRTSKLEVGEIDHVVLHLEEGEACDISGFGGGEVFSFTIDFSGMTTTSGSFVKP